MPVFRSFPGHNIVALFDEPNQIGQTSDINAPRNAPALNPGAHIALVHWHSAFFQYELAMPVQTVGVSHPSIAGRMTVWGFEAVYNGSLPTAPSQIGYQAKGNVAASNHTLVTHNLGYAPLAFVVYDGRMLMPGVAVQTASGGRSRFVSPYVTNSIVGLREVRNASDLALGAVSRTYHVMVFRVSAAQVHRALFGREAPSVVIGRGKVDTAFQYLRRVGAGDTPFNMDRGRSVDLANGRARIGTGGTLITEAGYDGSFQAPPFIPVGV